MGYLRTPEYTLISTMCLEGMKIAPVGGQGLGHMEQNGPAGLKKPGYIKEQECPVRRKV